MLTFLAIWGLVAEVSLPRTLPTEPSQAVTTLRLQNGFRAELIAAEPLVTDPIAITYDENGRAYVVEMNDYPYSDKSHDQAWSEQTSAPIGRIRLLEDRDGDGRFDQSTLFADELSWPSGIAIWKGGVYVAATPGLLYLKDLDGDHRADIRRKVFVGFRKYNVQAVINNLQWGLDHRIYAAGSSNGGEIQSVGQKGDDSSPETATDASSIRMGRNDFRFNPSTERFELIAGGARFGQTWDDWGNRFLCDIRNPIQHVVLPSRYLARNSWLPVASSLHDVAQSGDTINVFPISPPEPWRVVNARRLATDLITKSPHDATVAQGFITSCSGVTIYRGAAYPEAYAGNAFIGEVAGNLVMRYQIRPDGNSFVATRAHHATEFLASTDNWFRPVNFANAPDGMLHLLDMYRETIEHPWSMPDDLKSQVDLTSGRDRGRIFRLVPPKFREGFEKPSTPRLGAASVGELVAELENPNSWWRDTAHRLIFERQDMRAVVPLRTMLRDSRSAVSRIHAAWSLNGLQALERSDLLCLLTDGDARVRKHAVRLSETRLADPLVIEHLLPTASDDNIGVRFQAALTLGQIDDPRATEALAAIARRDLEDRWSRYAVLSSLSTSSVSFLLTAINDTQFGATQAGREMMGRLAYGIAARDDRVGLDRVLTALALDRYPHPASSTGVAMAIVSNIGAGLKRRGQHLEQLTQGANSGARLIDAMLRDAQATLLADDRDVESYQSAVRLVGLCSFDTARGHLTGLLDTRRPREVQESAIDALTDFSDSEVASLLLTKYPTLTPDLQARTISRLLTRTEWLVQVLDAIDAGEVQVAHVSPVRRQIYMNSSHTEIRSRARKLFQSDVPSPRKQVIAEYESALPRSSDASRGRQIYRKACASCHQLGTEGHAVGPNLDSVKHRTPLEILTHVLDPNREVAPNFMQYVIHTSDGRSITGVIVSETAASVTLQQAEGLQRTILRDEMEQMRSLGISLMPEGVERDITPHQMADLIAFLLSREE